MLKSRKNRFFFGTVFLAVIFLSALTANVKSAGAATSTIRGAAWWGNQGYVYFNCLDDVIGDNLDVEYNLSGAGKYLPPDDKFHFYSAPCVNFKHGVYLDDDNNFSGQAWNQTLEIISFESSSTPPDGYSFNSHCPDCNSGNKCIACYVPADQRVYGWAKILKNNSWVRLDTISPTTTPVFLQDWDTEENSVLSGHNIQAGDFIGDGTNDSYGIMSFNCESEDGGRGNCGVRKYKVYISDLEIGNASAPNWSSTSACSGQALKATLRWYKKSGQYPLNGEIVNRQTAYEVVVNNVDVLSTSTAVCWSGKKISSSANQYLLPNSDPTCGSLNYNTRYYWWVRLYDENDQPTGWFQYNSNSAQDTDGDPDGDPKTFTTFKHEFPSPYFTWDPYDITVGTTTLFTSDAYYYTANPNLQHSCAPGLCTYSWSVLPLTNPPAIISNATGATTTIVFTKATSSVITLKVWDADNYMCSTSTPPLYINYGLPIWREVKSKGNI